MKDFKHFNRKYEIGDYVKLSHPAQIKQTNHSVTYSTHSGRIENIGTGNPIYYKLTSFLLDTNELLTFWVTEDTIVRLLTPEEVKEFEFELDTKKYNL